MPRNHVDGSAPVWIDSSQYANLCITFHNTAAGLGQNSARQHVKSERKGPMLRTASKKTSEGINKKALSCFLTSIMLLMILPLFAGDKEKDEDTLRQANLVLQGFLNSNNISLTSLSKANCVLILPNVKKFGFGIGGSGGRGPLLCRSGQNFDGKWSTPAMYSVGGMSAGLQVGGSSTDFVLLLMTPKVVNQILNGKTKMGTDATAAAGPPATAARASDAQIRPSAQRAGAFALAS